MTTTLWPSPPALQKTGQGQQNHEHGQQCQVDTVVHFGDDYAAHVVAAAEDVAYLGALAPDGEGDVAARAVVVLAQAGKSDPISGLQLFCETLIDKLEPRDVRRGKVLAPRRLCQAFQAGFVDALVVELNGELFENFGERSF